MSRRSPNLVEALRHAAKKSRQTGYALAKGSGIDRAMVMRFLSGERGLNIDSAAKLAEYLNLELKPRKAGE